jgi:hypothetical protein
LEVTVASMAAGVFLEGIRVSLALHFISICLTRGTAETKVTRVGSGRFAPPPTACGSKEGR